MKNCVTKECRDGLVVYIIELGEPGETSTKFPIRCKVKCIQTFQGQRAEQFKAGVLNFVSMNLFMKLLGMCCHCKKCCKIPVCWSNRHCCKCIGNVDDYIPQYLDRHDHKSKSEDIENHASDHVHKKEKIDEVYERIVTDLLKRNPCFCNKCERCDKKKAEC